MDVGEQRGFHSREDVEDDDRRVDKPLEVADPAWVGAGVEDERIEREGSVAVDEAVTRVPTAVILVPKSLNRRR